MEPVDHGYSDKPKLPEDSVMNVRDDPTGLNGQITNTCADTSL